MSVKIHLNEKSRKYVEKIKYEEVDHRHNILTALNIHGDYVCEKLKEKIMTGERHGRVYTYKGKKYTASAPGEPPANRSGKLAHRFWHNQTDKQLTIYSSAFSDEGAPYPFFLERGTSKMEPRPYFVSTITENAFELRKNLYRKGKKD